jgi:hypothetical protein
MPGNIGIIASAISTPLFNPVSDWSLPPLQAFSTADPYWVPPADAGSVSSWRNAGSAVKGAYIGAKGLVCPGNVTTARADCATIADNAVLRPTGDIEVIVKATTIDWTPTAGKVLVLCGSNAGNSTVNWYLYYNTTGTLTFARPSGATARNFTSSVPIGILDGATKWIKATFDQNNGSAQSEVKFYLSDDGSSWTQLGSTLTDATTTAGNSDVTGVTIGQGVATAVGHAGTIHRVIAKDGIDGTTFLDVDFEAATEDAASFTESSSNAATVTINSVPKAAYLQDGLVLPQVSGNYASTPDVAALDITGNIELIAKVTVTAWTGAGARALISKHGQNSGDYGPFAWRVSDNGTMLLGLAPNGTTFTSHVSTAALSGGLTKWLRVTATLSGCTARFYYSNDATNDPNAVTWTQLGSDVTTTTIASLVSSNNPVCVGAWNELGTADMFRGIIRRALIKDGIGGTTVFDADFEAATDWSKTFTESSANAATVTINNSVDLVQTTGSRQPTYDAANSSYNNAPTVHFATDDALVSDIADVAQPYYMVVIGNVATAGVASDVFVGYGASTGNGLYEFSGGGYGSAIGSTYALGGTSNTSPHLIRATNNGASSTVVIDETPVAFGTVTGSITVLSLGAGNSGVSTFGYNLTGDIHTALVFSSDPSLQPEWEDFKTYVESTIAIDITPAPVALQAPTLLDSALYSPTNTCTSASISPAANSLLIITCVTGAAAGTFGFSSTTLTGIQSMGMIQQSSGNERVGVLWAKLGSSPGTGTVTINGFGTPGTTRAAMHVMEVVGAQRIRQTQIGTTTSANPSITLPYTPLPSSLVIGAIGLYGVTIPPGANFTELSESNANRALQTQYDLTNATSTVDWSLGASTLCAMAAIEITD